MATINFTTGKTHGVTSDPINETTFKGNTPYSLIFTTNEEPSEEGNYYTAALNGTISANITKSEHERYEYTKLHAGAISRQLNLGSSYIFAYSLISATGLDISHDDEEEEEDGGSSNYLTITTGAKAQNWKFNHVILSNQDTRAIDGYFFTGINASDNYLDFGESFGNNYGMAFTANLTVSVSGKDTEHKHHYAVIGIYSDNNIFVHGIMKGSVNVKNVQTDTSSLAYGFRTNSALLSYDITGKITVASESKVISSAIAVDAEQVDIECVRSDISATATCKASTGGKIALAQVFANADYIDTGAINAKLTATAKCTSTDAMGMDGMAAASATVMEGSDVTINGSITKNITATATSKTSAMARTFHSSGNYLDFKGAVAGNITATATGGLVPNPGVDTVIFTRADAISADQSLSFKSDITKNITATAKGELLAEARAIFKDYDPDDYSDINFDGTVKGKISANASVKKGAACAYGIQSLNGIIFSKSIDNAVSATASGSIDAVKVTLTPGVEAAYNTYMNDDVEEEEREAAKKILDKYPEQFLYLKLSRISVVACAFYSNSDIKVPDINGAITANATAKGGKATALAFDVGAGEEYNRLTVDNINKNITVTAKSSGSDSEAYAVAVGGPGAYLPIVYDEDGNPSIYDPDLYLNGSIKGKITVTATAKDKACAIGIQVREVVFSTESFSFGTINVTANGNKESKAIGLSFSELVTSTVRRSTITGNLSVTCKNGTATGIFIGNDLNRDLPNRTLAMNVKVTGKDARAIVFGHGDESVDSFFDTFCNLSGTVSATTTDKNTGTAYAIKSWDCNNNHVHVLNGAKITGDIDLGRGFTPEDFYITDYDALYIHSGANIKGDISNAEEVWFVLDDPTTTKKAMWQGDFDEEFFKKIVYEDTEQQHKLGISTYYGEEGTFTLFQSVNYDSAKFNGKEITLRIDDRKELTFNDKFACSFEDYDYKLNFTDDKKGGTTAALTITRKKLI